MDARCVAAVFESGGDRAHGHGRLRRNAEVVQHRINRRGDGGHGGGV